MTEDLGSVVDACVSTLERYVAVRDETALRDAYELGRAAMERGVGVLEMAQVGCEVLAMLLDKMPGERGRGDLLAACEELFVEALSPFEMALRGFREANTVLRRMNSALEDQSRRTATALHDEAAQLLTPLHLGLADLARHVQPDVTPDITHLRDLLRTIEERLRDLSHGLRPPILDHLGLVPALELLVASFSKRWGLRVRLSASTGTPMPATVETTLYHAIQEALTNVARHARATEVFISISRRTRTLVSTICDDGIGVAATELGSHAEGVGLAGIRERAAALGGAVHFGRRDDRPGAILTIEIPVED